ncbi:hypothetical protein KF707_07800 [Candidatus Obscuribacterales bacterium]|nr:hypothetical protein [Candidatus Obscuribacterales bacterium]MBX3149613.1 hypothetical protein [Candidatus Obscuribacterales bacterium]
MQIGFCHKAKGSFLPAYIFAASLSLFTSPAAAGTSSMPTPGLRSPAIKTPALKPPTQRPKALRGSIRKTTRKAVSQTHKKSSTVKTDENKNRKPVGALKNVSGSEDEPSEAAETEPEFIETVPNPDGNRVNSLFPHASTAKMIEDKAFRLMVTIDGTKFKNEEGNSMKLESGSVLVSPSHKIKVATPSCWIELQEGSVVSIDATEDTTYVRDFHDRWKGHVVVHVNDKDINLMPGAELIVTKETDPDKAWQKAVRHHIRRRGLAEYKTGVENLTVFRGDFSIPDAMLKSRHFLYLKEHPDAHARSVLDEITKTAALLHITDHSGPYTLLR